MANLRNGFQDSDVTKWLEAVAWSLSQKPDAALEQTADEVIELLAQAQCEDGYLNTWYTVKEPGQRWTNLAECHELYCAGHLLKQLSLFIAPPANVVCWKSPAALPTTLIPSSDLTPDSFAAIRDIRKSN